VALLTKPTDMFKVLCQLVMMLISKVPLVHDALKTTPALVPPDSEPTEIE